MRKNWELVVLGLFFFAIVGAILYVQHKHESADLVLAVAQGAVELVGSGAAIFGETFTKRGTTPFYRRITLRGWVAIACMALTFGLESEKDRRSIEAGQKVWKDQQALLMAIDSHAKAAAENAAKAAEGIGKAQTAGNSDNQTPRQTVSSLQNTVAKSGFQRRTNRLKVMLGVKRQESQSQFAGGSIGLRPIADHDHGLQAQIGTPEPPPSTGKDN